MRRTGRGLTALVVVCVAMAALLAACGGGDDSKSGSGSGGGSGGGSSASKPKVYEAGDSITVKNGDAFVIALEANPSTGYSWQAAPNANVQPVSSKQVQGTSNAIGAPGTQQLTFKAVQTGSSTLTLDYLRPFDPPSTAPRADPDLPRHRQLGAARTDWLRERPEASQLRGRLGGGAHQMELGVHHHGAGG